MKKIVLIAVIGLAIFAGCKNKKSEQRIVGNWIQVAPTSVQQDYVEAFVNDSTFLIYNRSWGFLNEDQFKYSIEKGVLTFVNRQASQGNKATVQYFLPDSFKLDYGDQVFTYLRIPDDANTLDKYNEIGYEPYRKGYDYRRASFLDKDLPLPKN